MDAGAGQGLHLQVGRNAGALGDDRGDGPLVKPGRLQIGGAGLPRFCEPAEVAFEQGDAGPPDTRHTSEGHPVLQVAGVVTVHRTGIVAQAFLGN